MMEAPPEVEIPEYIDRKTGNMDLSVGEGHSQPRVSRGSKRKKKELVTTNYAQNPYPVDALGGLSGVADEIAGETQTNVAIVGQCLLATVSLITQCHADVRALAGNKPISGSYLTIADSGDGKTSVEACVLEPIYQYQRTCNAAYVLRIKEYLRALDRCKKGDEKPEKPEKPVNPNILTQNATAEGLRNNYRDGVSSQGLFTSEGAAVMCGYGMQPERKMATAGFYNALSDEGRISVSRAGFERIEMFDRRFTQHLMIQPAAAKGFLQDQDLVQVGYLPRFLCSWPDPGKPRKARLFPPEQNQVIKDFRARCADLLSRQRVGACENLPVAKCDADAVKVAVQFFEEMENAAKTANGVYAPIKPFALRATEIAHRVAGALAIFAGEEDFDGAPEITGACMEGAIRLIRHSLETWLGIYGAREDAAISVDARKLLDWMIEQGSECWEVAMLRYGPRPRISAADRDAALSTLHANGLIRQTRHKYWVVAS